MARFQDYPKKNFNQQQNFLARDPNSAEVVRVPGSSLLEGVQDFVEEKLPEIEIETATGTDTLDVTFDKRTIPVNTVAQLRDLPGAKPELRVSWAGYYNKLDGGGNEGIVELRDGSADDGGSVFYLNDGVHQVRGLFERGLIRPEQIGLQPTGDQKDVMDRFFSISSTLGLIADLRGVQVLTSGPHSISSSSRVLADGFLIKRVPNYSGGDPLLIVEDNVKISGAWEADGNFPTETGQVMASIAVPGDNVSFDELLVTNTPCTFFESTRLRGCSVSGDNFYCGKMVGRNSGYSTLQLLLDKALNSFTVDSFYSFDHDFKGFVVNGGTGTIESIDIKYAYIDTDTLFDASECILVDTGNNITLQNIKSLNIGYGFLNGGQSNAIKVENVVTFTAGTLHLKNGTNYVSREAMRNSCRNTIIDKLILDDSRRVRYFGQNIVIKELFIKSLDGSTNVIRADDSTFVGRHSIKIDSIHQLEGTSSIIQFIGMNYSGSNPLDLYVGDIFSSADGIQTFGLFGGANAILNGGSCYIGNNRSKRDIHWGNTPLDSATQIAPRFFQGTSAPNAGTFSRGDFVIDTNARPLNDGISDFAPRGWLCIESGAVGSGAEFVQQKVRYNE